LRHTHIIYCFISLKPAISVFLVHVLPSFKLQQKTGGSTWHFMRPSGIFS
jgi:hypothetical protein